MTTIANPPVLQDVKSWLGLAADDVQDDALLQTSLDAALSAQAMVVTDDLFEAVLLRTQRLAARRNSPEGVIGLTGVGGDFVSARVPSTDPDVLRLEGPYLKIAVA